MEEVACAAPCQPARCASIRQYIRSDDIDFGDEVTDADRAGQESSRRCRPVKAPRRASCAAGDVMASCFMIRCPL
jgi:hypothetical protein